MTFVLGVDAGGTMTDSYLVDEEGNVYIDKALTRPEEQYLSFLEAAEGSINQTGKEIREAFSNLAIIVYTSTLMLNTLLTSRGRRAGIIITRGFRDYIYINRGNTWLGLSFEDRVHAARRPNWEPFIEGDMIEEVTERINQRGEIVIPLKEEEVKSATERLIGKGVEAIGIVFLYSIVNPSHEERAKRIVERVVGEKSLDIPVITSSEISPYIREYSRLNSTMIECAAGPDTRNQLLKIEETAKKKGYKHDVLIVLAYGGLGTVKHSRLYETIISGPIGGLIAGKYVGGLLGAEDIVCMDEGGTSFDLGIIKGGRTPIDREPIVEKYRLNLPMYSIRSVAAGTGAYIGYNEELDRYYISEKSAGDKVGVCWRSDKPTITDCDVILNNLNPEYFLGGKIKLDRKKSLDAIENLASIKNQDPYDFASKILGLLHARMADHIRRELSSRGYSPANFTAMIYGGGGPLHMYGILKEIRFREAITFPWAAAFSAAGVAMLDYKRRVHSPTYVALPYKASEEAKIEEGRKINEGWQKLEEEVVRELKREGRDPERAEFAHIAYLRYQGQLEDFEVVSPVNRIKNPEDMDGLIGAFEQVYEEMYPRAMKFSEAGYLCTELAVEAIIKTPKPRIPKYELGPKDPEDRAYKGQRSVFWDGEFMNFTIMEMDWLAPGNVVEGPSIIEHPMTTLVIPPSNMIYVDEYKFIRWRWTKK